MIKPHKLKNSEHDGYVYLAKLNSKNTYKIGQTKNPEQRLFWLIKDYDAIDFISLWEVPDLDYCERVALSMTRKFTTCGEVRNLTPEFVNIFTSQFLSFVSCIDDPEFQTKNTGVKFIYWDDSKKNTIVDRFDNNLNLDLVKEIAAAVIKNGCPFARIPLSKRTSISQDKYRLMKNEFEKFNFVVCSAGNRTNLTKLGNDFLRSLL